MKLILILSLLSSFALSAKDTKIVNGEVPTFEHPGSYNTVALIKAETNKIFCTGSIISKRLILTAKHCLMGKKAQDFKIFFGPDTNDLSTGVIIKTTRFKVRRPIDWEMTFPSFDVAWIELAQDIPDGFKPLPILSQKEELPKSPAIHLVGHGNSAITDGKIEAGKKFFTTTLLKKYYDNPRFFHILLFEGPKGQGACHGDSGGPAYVQKGKDWFITGVTNGFDIVLTPKAMRRTSDTEFPYLIDCKANQNLYSFAGAHGAWIEKTSGRIILKSKKFTQKDLEATSSNDSINEWCTRRDIGSPRWNLLKLLLDQKVDKMPQDKAEAFYNNCAAVQDYLLSLKEIVINGEKTMNAHYSFAPFHLLKIDSLKVFEFDSALLSFKSPFPYSIGKLQLNRLKIENLDFLMQSPIAIKELNISFNPLNTLRGIKKLTSLRSLGLSKTQIRDFSALEELPFLESLDLSFTSLVSPTALKNLRLKRLTLGGDNLKTKDLQALKGLEELSIISSSLVSLDFLANSPGLTTLNLPRLDLADLSVFSKFKFDSLRELNLTGNPIQSFAPLGNLPSLSRLRVFGTPLARGQIAKTPENCPLTGASVLTKFCSK